MSSKISVPSVLPERLLQAINGTQIQNSVMLAEWDRSEISKAMLTFDASMKKNGVDLAVLSKQDLAVGKLLFWLQHSESFISEFYPHPKYAFSRYLTEKINDVWDAQPGLLAPGAHWTRGKGDVGYNLAETLCRNGILLDSLVLNDGPKQVLQRAFSSKRCINLAVSKYRLGVLDMMTTLSPAARESVYSKLCTPQSLATVCDNACNSLVADTRFAVYTSGIPRGAFPHSRVMSGSAARRLLTGMAEAGVKSQQIGWSSGCKQKPRDLTGRELQCALKCVAEQALVLAGSGYGLDGLRELVGDVGTIVGYTPECVGEKSLASEFAGAFSLEIMRIANNNWPSDFASGVIWARHDGRESFLDGVLNYFVESDILADDVVGILDTGLSDCTLRYAFKTADFPPGTIDGYEAMCRARAMKGVIAGAAADKTDCFESSVRRGMRV